MEMVMSDEEPKPAGGTHINISGNFGGQLAVGNQNYQVSGGAGATPGPSTSGPATPSATPAPAMPSAEALARAASLKAAFGELIATLDEVGNPELLTKARELRTALQQDEPDLSHIVELRRWFSGRPGAARTAVEVFFAAPIVQEILQQAMQRELDGA
jgi:hypothetical protein